MSLTQKSISQISTYKPARLHTGKCWYISFHVFDPESERLKIKRIKLNYIGKATERRRYANELIIRINNNLAQGWNPYLDQESKKGFAKISVAIAHYKRVHEKKHQAQDIRSETYVAYLSFLRNFESYLTKKELGEMYIYKLDRSVINDFLEYIYLDKDRSSQTRNNYLAFLRIFSGFLVEKEYSKVRPTDGISNLGKKYRRKKGRIVIEPKDRERLKKYLLSENVPYLLSCQVLYYCFIRPKEMSYIKIHHVNLERGTIFVPGETAKNHQDSIVTIPIQLLKFMKQLNIKQHPGDYYLFADHFSPGPKRRDEKQFRDYWLKIRKQLNFPPEYKFYSLKDTGIIDLIGQIGDPRIVRDQARHHSISITDIYTPHDIMKANPIIAENQSEF